MNPTSPTTHDAHDHHGGPTDIENEGINASFVFGIMLGTIVIVIMLVAVGFTVTSVKSLEIRNVATAAIQYPELRSLRADAASRLSHYATVDAGSGVYQIPIQEAMKAIANEAYAKGMQAAHSSEPRLAQPIK
ncbi:MAG: hypothetical protein SH809_14435 [Rhodothermales bacterium]|nr:hypothetical protein [Rhodothermales bacterium]